MTGDVGEYFNDLKEASKIKREKNRNDSAEMLTRCGIKFISKNGGAHLIVSHNDRVVDFWPGTGQWNDRAMKKYCRGVKKLIHHLQKFDQIIID